MESFAIKGDLIWTEKPDSFMTIHDGYITVSDGRITSVSYERPSADIVDRSGYLVIPGLSDLHIHAPQYVFMGMHMDEELLEWLEKHTFPAEAAFSDTGFAREAYGSFAEALLKTPTTRLSAFGTIHEDSTLILMDILGKAGFHGYVGKVNMDRNSPDSLVEDTDESIASTRSFIERSSAYSSIRPIITPRFIPSCSDRLLKELGRIASGLSIPIQSHLDENRSEIEWVASLCPWARDYASAYDSFSLLTDRTIMAHCVWMTDDEIDLLKARGTYIAHSPTSNLNLSSGIAPVRRFMDRGINTGLATDTAGGSSLSMFRMITDAITSSKLRWRLVDNSLAPLKFSEAFYLASKGGGSFFGKAGSFEEGYAADILVLDDVSSEMTVLAPELSLPEKLEFYAYRAPDRRPVAKYVAGKRIV